MAGFVLDSYDVLLYVFVVQTLRAEFHWSRGYRGPGQFRHSHHLRAGRHRRGLSFGPHRPAANAGSHHPDLFHRLRRIGFGHRPCDAHLLAIHRRIRTRWRMVGRRCAGSRKLAAATSRQSHRADAIRLGHWLYARRGQHRVHSAALRMACTVSYRTISGDPDHLDPAQSEGAAAVEQGGRETRRESLAGSLPSAARQTNISHHRARHVHALRLLGTQHLAPRISFRASLAGRRRTQHRSKPAPGFSSCSSARSWATRASAGWPIGGDAARPFSSTSSSPPCSRPSTDSLRSGPDASSEFWLLALGPLVGFFGTGFFSLFGTMLAELYPTSIRGSAQGFVYNTGRAASALAPFAIGAIADRHGLGYGLALNSAFFLIGAALIFTLPETKGTELN